MSEFNREELSQRLINEFKQGNGEEEFEDDDDEDAPRIKILLPLVILSVIGFIAYALYSDKVAITADKGGDIPLVKASADPVRVRPEDPGGMQVANRDKTIYDTISAHNDEELPKVVRIRPKAEEPVSREVITQNDIEVDDILGNMKESMPEESEAPKEEAAVEKKPEEPKLISKQELVSAEVVEKKPEPVKVVSVPKGTIAEAVPKQEKKGYKIQLGSYRSQEDVNSTWKNVKKKHASLIGDMSYSTEKADLKDKGVFYRLQAGFFDNESKARELCQKLTEAGQGCFVVKGSVTE